MLLTMFRRISILFFVLALFNPAHGEEVEATGFAPIVEGNTIGARRVALEDAKKSAVEQILGSFIESRTAVSAFVLAKDSIESTVKGRVENYTFLEDVAVNDSTYKVVIRATINSRELMNSAAEAISKYHWHKKPRISVALNSLSPGYGDSLTNRIQQTLQDRFRKEGYDVFDGSDGNINQAGFELVGDVFIESQESEYQGIKLQNNEISVNVKLKRVGSGTVISTASFSDSASGSNQARVTKKIVKNGARKLYRDVSKEMINTWLRNQTRASDVIVEVSGRDVSGSIQKIKGFLSQSLRGVERISLVGADKERGVISLSYIGWPEQLYSELDISLQRNASIGLSLDGMQGNKLSLRIN